MNADGATVRSLPDYPVDHRPKLGPCATRTGAWFEILRPGNPDGMRPFNVSSKLAEQRWLGHRPHPALAQVQIGAFTSSKEEEC